MPDDTPEMESEYARDSSRPPADLTLMPRADENVDRFNEQRPLLLSIAYRMLGSRADAEDMVQETFLRWRETSDIRDTRAFLVTVITRLCINQLQSARIKREQYFGQWLPEPILTSGEPNLTAIDGSVSMAFLLLLERLTPPERAVFLLREVFEYQYAEVARALGQSEANCRQILRRARQHIALERPRFGVSRARQQVLLQRFLETTSTGNMQSLISLLARDVILYTDGGGKATAVPNPIFGPERVARFFFVAPRKFMPKHVERRFTDVNGQPGIVVYSEGKIFGVLAIDTTDTEIRRIFIVRNPDKLKGIPGMSYIQLSAQRRMRSIPIFH
jgi:RNA polymerase sigma-70 factor (ECF subfamily)